LRKTAKKLTKLQLELKLIELASIVSNLTGDIRSQYAFERCHPIHDKEKRVPEIGF